MTAADQDFTGASISRSQRDSAGRNPHFTGEELTTDAMDQVMLALLLDEPLG
jgi:hypothetical protein